MPGKQLFSIPIFTKVYLLMKRPNMWMSVSRSNRLVGLILPYFLNQNHGLLFKQAYILIEHGLLFFRCLLSWFKLKQRAMQVLEEYTLEACKTKNVHASKAWVTDRARVTIFSN